MVTKGIEFNEAHFPGQAPIDAYGNGGFRFAGMSHKGSLLCLPSGIYAWEPMQTSGRLGSQDFDKVFEEAGSVEVLLIGTGDALVPLTDPLRDKFRAKGISADAMPTGPAVRTYNVLVSEGRAVAAALLAVD